MDADESGRLAGQPYEAALEDMACADAIQSVLKHPYDMTLEAQIGRHFSKLWCDPQSASYRLKTPLTPSEPPVGMTLEARAKLEAARWFAALPGKYKPVPLSRYGSLRIEARLTHLTAISPDFAERYKAAMRPFEPTVAELLKPKPC